MSANRSVSVAGAVARRSIRKLIGNPVATLAQLAIPLFFFAAFTGALSVVGQTPGFHYYNFTAFEFVFVLFQGAIFAGVFTGIEIAFDFSGGVANRLMLAAPRRAAIIGGYLVVSLVRALATIAIFWAIALATGMPVRGNALQIAGLIALALLLNLVTALWGAGIALRLRSIQAGALITIPAFIVMFLSPVFVPRDRLNGWLKDVAGVNPFTPPLEAGRGLMAHQPFHTALAFGILAGAVLVFAAWALRGMRSAERGPGSGERQRRARGPRARRATA
jgi:ABC-2 type transport system permease protein